MRIWLASFILLFVLAQLFQWMKQLSLPLPVFIVGGLLLAIASNYDKRSGWPFAHKLPESQVTISQSPIVMDAIDLPKSPSISTLTGKQDSKDELAQNQTN
ncbi:hypothetical protein H6S82_24865 [Planktothrix sp. FACHB-1355]|uniref:Uncharacterized protein n=1 Tax=Aerosakkonema funiforme FACHB-1375 TaxID=2949571 RepID=A0A926VI44_9CYAN|nr:MULTISPECIES: hypothetical protein [Oscillatoriales]MBD2184189.1 hypothetical protein [Aerosakkonema funiforme FACHB-1375]MBD3562053.1 hypothetical protein [Planktothrix sp. FACHB-1355]